MSPVARQVLPPWRVAHPLTVFAHQPDAKMSKRRLGNLPRAGDISLERDPISGGHHHRSGRQSIRLDRHARRHMDDSANPSVFLDGKIAARIIPSHHPSRPQPVETAKRRFLGAGRSCGRSFLRCSDHSPMPSSVISTMMGSPPPARRSEIMAAIRSKGTRPEIAVRRYLHATARGCHLYSGRQIAGSDR